MGAAVRLHFPPLTSVVALDGAPRVAIELLRGRWMAEPPPDELAPTFTLVWRQRSGAGEPGGDPAWAVRWRASGNGGRLSNDTGRLLPELGTGTATVEIESDVETRGAGLEALLEAALGHALTLRGECLLHAAAFEIDGRRPLVIGDTGTGKSTLTAAAIACGGRAVSDDSLLLGLGDGSPLVRAARRDLWLRPGSRALEPALARRGIAAEAAEDGRRRFRREAAASAFVTATRPDCLVSLLTPTPGQTGVQARPLSQAEALACLLKGTSALYLTEPRFADRRRRLSELMTLYAERLPAIELALDRSPLAATAESIAAIVEALP